MADVLHALDPTHRRKVQAGERRVDEPGTLCGVDGFMVALVAGAVHGVDCEACRVILAAGEAVGRGDRA